MHLPKYVTSQESDHIFMSNEAVLSKKASFLNLGLVPDLLSALEKQQFTIPTPIQEKAIPVAITEKDIIGIAQTGTGKTMAFGLPMMQRIAKTNGQGLILLPTRELAMQVEESLLKIGRTLGLKTAILVGGASMSMQRQRIYSHPHIIIGTPGRIIDHLQRRNLNLSKVNTLVLDEADRMLDMGFAPQIKEVLETVPTDRQTMLFSATMPGRIVAIASKYMKSPIRIEVAQSGTAAEKVEQEMFVVNPHQKRLLVSKLLKQYKGTVLIFTRTKFGASKLCRFLITSGFSTSEIHSNKSFAQRQVALNLFKQGRSRILVATDVASRGIDVSNIELVINYDLPDDPEDYVHRIGRTGRAGKGGRAISFAMSDQKYKVVQIERLIRNSISISKTPELELPTQPAFNSFRPVQTRTNTSFQGRGRSSFQGQGRGQKQVSGQGNRRFPKRNGGQFNYGLGW